MLQLVRAAGTLKRELQQNVIRRSRRHLESQGTERMFCKLLIVGGHVGLKQCTVEISICPVRIVPPDEVWIDFVNRNLLQTYCSVKGRWLIESNPKRKSGHEFPHAILYP